MLKKCLLLALAKSGNRNCSNEIFFKFWSVRLRFFLEIMKEYFPGTDSSSWFTNRWLFGRMCRNNHLPPRLSKAKKNIAYIFLVSLPGSAYLLIFPFLSFDRPSKNVGHVQCSWVKFHHNQYRHYII